MSQNEQNVRTQSAQIAEIVERVTDLSLVNCYPDFGEVQDWIIEAEARGAAEQRRKDAEGREPVAWVNPNHLPDGEFQRVKTALWDRKADGCILPLYTHPANVAALEARVKELEEAADNLVIAIGMGWDLEGIAKIARAALTREGGV